MSHVKAILADPGFSQIMFFSQFFISTVFIEQDCRFPYLNFLAMLSHVVIDVYVMYVCIQVRVTITKGMPVLFLVP